MKIYLGYDGSYVMSRYKLKMCRDIDRDGTPIDYLTSGRKNSCVDEHSGNWGPVFRGLKLKPGDVVELAVRAKRKARLK